MLWMVLRAIQSRARSAEPVLERTRDSRPQSVLPQICAVSLAPRALRASPDELAHLRRDADAAVGSISEVGACSRHVRFPPIATKLRTSREVRFVPILLQKSVASGGGQSVMRPTVTGFDLPALTPLRNSDATQCTGLDMAAPGQPVMRAGAGSGRWRREQTHPGRLVGRAA